jgi:hypothetical protein
MDFLPKRKFRQYFEYHNDNPHIHLSVLMTFFAWSLLNLAAEKACEILESRIRADQKVFFNVSLCPQYTVTHLFF